MTGVTEASACAPDSGSRASYRLWQLDWARVLPWTLGEGIVSEFVPFERAMPFIRANYGTIFDEESSAYAPEALSSAKLRFYAECDIFLFRDGERDVGVMIGHPTDWSSYYVRTTALLDEYQGKAIAAEHLVRMMSVLRAADVQRLDIETAPSNQVCMRTALRLGFNATAMSLSERWGALTRFTAFLSRDHERSFIHQFSGTTAGSSWKRCDERKGDPS